MTHDKDLLLAFTRCLDGVGVALHELREELRKRRFAEEIEAREFPDLGSSEMGGLLDLKEEVPASRPKLARKTNRRVKRKGGAS